MQRRQKRDSEAGIAVNAEQDALAVKGNFSARKSNVASRISGFHIHNFDWKYAIVSMIVLGIAVGFACVILSFLLAIVEYVTLGFVENVTLPGAFTVPPIRRILSIMIVGIIAAVSWYWIRKKSVIPTVNDYIRQSYEAPIMLSLWHIVLQILIVGAGFSLGRETAPRELAALIAQRWNHRWHKSQIESSTMIAISAAAGLAGIYNAPWAGIFFTFEVLRLKAAWQHCVLAVGTSWIAVLVVRTVRGEQLFYKVSFFPKTLQMNILLWIIVTAFFSALLGVIFTKVTSQMRLYARKDYGKRSILWTIPLVACCTAVTAAIMPHVMGNGRAIAQMGFSLFRVVGYASEQMSLPIAQYYRNQHIANCHFIAENPALHECYSAMFWPIIPMLMMTLLLKFCLTAFSLRCGLSGGTITPAIALGSMVGLLSAITLHMGLHIDNVNTGLFACVGATVCLAAAQRAPLMAVGLMSALTQMPFTDTLGLAVLSYLVVIVVEKIRNLQPLISRKISLRQI